MTTAHPTAGDTYRIRRPPRPRPVLRHGPGRWFRDWLGEALIRLGRRVRGKPRKWPRIER